MILIKRWKNTILYLVPVCRVFERTSWRRRQEDAKRAGQHVIISSTDIPECASRQCRRSWFVKSSCRKPVSPNRNGRRRILFNNTTDTHERSFGIGQRFPEANSFFSLSRIHYEMQTRNRWELMNTRWKSFWTAVDRFSILRASRKIHLNIL